MFFYLSTSLFTGMAPALRYHLGVWGEPTSTLDWCEENYVVTKYVAEFCKYSSFVFSQLKL